MKRWRTTVLALMLAPLLTTGLLVSPASARPVEPMAASSCRFLTQGLIWPVTGNWDGIGGDGVGVVREEGDVLVWYLRNSATPGPADYVFAFGDYYDFPVVGNWDGVGGDSPGLAWQDPAAPDEWRWRLRNNLTTGPADHVFNFGRFVDTPITGNWDGIGGDSPGFFRSASPWNEWHLRNSPNAGAADYLFTYGTSQDEPMAGNWDGAGGDGPGVVRAWVNELEWHLRNSLSAGPADSRFLYGDVNRDCHVPGNWDGTGGDGIGVVRQVGGALQWHLRNSPTPGAADTIFSFGAA